MRIAHRNDPDIATDLELDLPGVSAEEGPEDRIAES